MHYTRRDFLRTSALLGAASCLTRLPAHAASKDLPDWLTPKTQILDAVNRCRPLRGATIPRDIAGRLATAHVSGRYHFTSEPFVVEGVQRIRAMGLGGAKLWFSSINRAYRWNSQWNLPEHYTLLELAQHPYFARALDEPLDVFALEVYPANNPAVKAVPGHSVSPLTDFAVDEQQIYELTRHLLTKYRTRDVTFILQNWEGDWMFRGDVRKQWLAGEYPELDLRVDTFRKWFDARQRGVERARAEIAGSRCRVYHAVELNKVLDSLKGIPTLATHVLPHIRPDFISWSAYDGMRTDKHNGNETAVGLWHGIDVIKHYAHTAQPAVDGRAAVYLGEAGVPEEMHPEGPTVDIMDATLGVTLARDLPWLFHWELYCNERKDGDRVRLPGPDTAEELRGFWLVKPDGSLGYTGKYFADVLAHAGKTLPARG